MNRPIYINKLIRKMHNGMIKVITGLRRSGKTYLLFELFYNYLRQTGIPDDHIIKLSLDDRMFKQYRDPDVLCEYVHSCIRDDRDYYILLDEVQMADEFEDVLNSFLHIKNADTFVTGSNAKFLSKDIITEFRGRADQVHIYPLSFSEFCSGYNGDRHSAWTQYSMYGGLPKLLDMNEADKTDYLKNIFAETYIKDIIQRNNLKQQAELEPLLDFLASSIGGLTNPKKLSDTFKSVSNASIHPDTIKKYLSYFEDSFLVSKILRYDVKGKRYINTPFKFYFTDVGLRNARLSFRQYEEPHIMENVVYNELILRGYNVDAGAVEYSYYDNHQRKQKQLEVDFVCNLGSSRIYIQVALNVATEQKMKQEQQSLVSISDSFKKVIIAKDTPTHYNEQGILILDFFDFLLDEHSLHR